MGASGSPWRLIVDRTPRSGAANMAIDEVLAMDVAAGQSPPTLRLYGWTPPCVSIGRFQPMGDVNHQTLQEAGVELVRRLTGGRALLHAEEVTYAVMLPQAHAIAQRGVLESYRHLSAGLVETLHLLTLEADTLQPARRVRTPVSAACMEVPSAYEITVGGRKLIGSAQCRRAGYVLQHGSLPLAGHASELLPFLNLDATARTHLDRKLQTTATTVTQELSTNAPDADAPGWEDVAASMVRGFAHGLALDWMEDSYRPAEMEAAAHLIRTRYAHDQWTSLK